jgi:hypothetical protein
MLIKDRLPCRWAARGSLNARPMIAASVGRCHARRRHEVRDFAGVSDQRLRRIAVPLSAPAFAGPPMPDG